MKHIKILALLPVACFLCATAHADLQGVGNTLGSGDPALPLNGVWQGPFDEQFSPNTSGTFNETWTFTGAAELRITDLYIVGDNYIIYDNGVEIGSTHVADYTSYVNPSDTADPSVAWTDSEYAHFDDILGAGSHSITIFDTTPSGYTDGTYSISAVAVPEPTTMLAGAMLLLPFGATTLRILRKKSMA